MDRSIPAGPTSPYAPSSFLPPKSAMTTSDTQDSYFKEYQPDTFPPMDQEISYGWTPNSTPDLKTQQQYANSPSQPRRKIPLIKNYWAISNIFGFRETYSLALWFVFGGALAGFGFARIFMLNPSNVEHETYVGEWFWYRQGGIRVPLFIHIYLSIFAVIGAIFQFIPAIRRRKMILHRINGYMTLLLLIPGTIGGGIVGRRAFGGSVEMQAAYYTLAVLVVGAGTIGISKVKETRKHRKWMLRMVAYAGAVVTARIVSGIAREIIGYSGKYFSVWSCAELLYVQSTGKGDPNFDTNFPACRTTTNVDNTFVLVRASNHALHINKSSGVRLTFGVGLWIGMIIHIILIEFYIRATESNNVHRTGFVLERAPAQPDGSPEKSLPAP